MREREKYRFVRTDGWSERKPTLTILRRAGYSSVDLDGSACERGVEGDEHCGCVTRVALCVASATRRIAMRSAMRRISLGNDVPAALQNNQAHDDPANDGPWRHVANRLTGWADTGWLARLNAWADGNDVVHVVIVKDYGLVDKS